MTDALEDRLASALQEYEAAMGSDQGLDLKSFLGKYADVADGLKGCLHGLELLQDISDLDESKAGASDTRNKIGDYRILHRLVHSATGLAFRAEQISLGRRVFLRILADANTLDARLVLRFRNEVRAAATLKHPHIVPIYDVGVERGLHYCAMRYIDGRNLREIIQQSRDAQRGMDTGERQTIERAHSQTTDQGDQGDQDTPANAVLNYEVELGDRSTSLRRNAVYRRSRNGGCRSPLRCNMLTMRA